MKIIRQLSEARRRHFRDRGSALLTSLMVLAGMSLLALAFVGISETESAISANERNAVQTRAVAEAGARAAVEWFQAPSWARSIGILPDNASPPAGMKRVRTIGGYSGVYKPLSTQLLFDLPFRPGPQHRFYGDDTTADITIDYTIDGTTMANLNTYLFGSDSPTAGHIAEIKVYAPPMVGGVLTADGFWEGGDRFGTATIKVTAEKWSRATNGVLLSRQIVRVVVGEFPLPIPAGPIQSAANATFGGSFDVHWGDEVALGNLNPSVARTRLPWQNAFNHPSFERGYDNVVWPLDDPPGGAVEYQNMLNELAGKSFQDPWAGARARGTVSICGACGTYNQTSVEGQPIHAAFQGQITTSYPTMRAVTFPTIDYTIWKRIAIQGRGTKGVFYFQYAGSGNYRLSGQGTARPIAYWVNTRGSGAKLGPGFYFFDTTTGANPQLTGGGTNAAILGPAVSWNAADFGGDFLMSGFVYLNIAEYGSTGAGTSATALPYNMPGEVYRDVGYREWDTAAGAWVPDGAGNPVIRGSGDGEWSFQDLNDNGRFDVVVSSAPISLTSLDPGVSAARSVYLPKTWSGNTCTVPGTNPATDCSEPHEPYLNMIYPTTNSGSVTIGWEPNATQTRRPRDLFGTSLPNCNTQPDLCTSNGYDRDGALVDIPATLAGVLYNEGTYSSQGNVDYFGSVLIRSTAGATGNAQVWFDEKLIKDNWAPPGMPRVILYSSETDEQ
jgi:hypothetical protein